MPPTTRAPFAGKDERRTGEDAFGKFRITGGPCTNCSQAKLMCIHYSRDEVMLPKGIEPSDTILRDPTDTYLGINCGCYAKLHRQVAHIQDKMRQRKSS